MRRRARGFLLLPMALTLVAVGALAYAMTRDAGTSITRVDAQYDTEAARYLAEAAVNLARWNNNLTNCGKTPAPAFNPTPLYRYSLATNKVGTTAADKVGTMTLNTSSVVSTNTNNDKGSLAVDVSSTTTSATASTPAASQRIVRTVLRYNLSNMKQVTIAGGGGGVDSFIYTGANPVPQGTAAYMELTDNGPANQSYGLLRFGLGAVPKNALVKDATLRLSRISGDVVWAIQKLAIHRITTPWDPATATWSFPWTNGGGDYAPTPVDSSLIVGNISYYLRLDGLVAGWVDGSVANNGVLLKPTNQSRAHFGAFGSGGADDPQLTVTFYERCN